jgi:predicted glycosyltransferase
VTERNPAWFRPGIVTPENVLKVITPTESRRPPAAREQAAPHAGRYLLFTNECVGLGHLRRAMTLAEGITSRDPAASVLIVSGSALAAGYRLPPRVDTVKIPELAKDSRGVPHPERLGIDADSGHRLRSQISLGAAQAFAPDVVVVDKVPLGLGDELRPALEWLRARGSRIVLGLRDIEDDPDRVRERWGTAAMRRDVERYFDMILVYGPPTAPDALQWANWEGFDLPVEHVGYVGRTMPSRRPDDLPDRYLLVTPGGGADGFDVVATTLEAARLSPIGIPILAVTGPLMPAQHVARVKELAHTVPGTTVTTFRPDMDAVIAGATAAVTMAGYNTVAELVAAGVPALLVPRVRPSAEQLVRATAAAQAGLVRMIPQPALSPRAVRHAIDLLLSDDRPIRQPSGGTARAARILGDLVPAVNGAAR